METSISIILTQIPIAVAILLATYELHKLRKALERFLKRLENKKL